MLITENISDYIFESLAFQRIRKSVSETDFLFFRKVFQEYIKINPFLPPLGIIFDLSILFSSSTGMSNKEIFDISASKISLAYEEYFLGRILNDPRLDRCRNLISSINPNIKALAIATLIDQIFIRLKGSFNSPSNVLLNQTLFSFPLPTLKEKTQEALGSKFHSIQKTYQDIIEKTKQSGSLIADSDIYVLENIEILVSRKDRLALSQVADVSEIVKRFFPPQAKKVRDRGRTDSQIKDESSYPIGGYSGMSNQGSIESLVSTELVYMDPTESLDFFDLRYLSNELLKYTRDESIYRRDKRLICLIFKPDLTRARKKDPSLPFQRGTLLLGAVVAGINKMVEWLNSSDLFFRVYFPPVLSFEQNLMKLLLKRHIQSDIVSFEEYNEDLDIEEEAEEYLVDLVYFNTQKEESKTETETEKKKSLKSFCQEHILTLSKEPILQSDSKVIFSGDQIESWSRLFSTLFELLV